jgi:hypothetical protein
MSEPPTSTGITLRQAHGVGRAVEASRTVCAGAGEPVGPDQHQHDLAFIQGARDGLDEVLAVRDRIDVHENMPATQGFDQAVAQPSRVAGCVGSSIG